MGTCKAEQSQDQQMLRNSTEERQMWPQEERFLFENLQEKMEKVPHEHRGTICNPATALDISKSVLFDMMKEQKEAIIATTIALKPMLNDEQMLA